jgi:hypothetical protein
MRGRRGMVNGRSRRGGGGRAGAEGWRGRGKAVTETRKDGERAKMERARGKARQHV